MTKYELVEKILIKNPKTWLVTGAAGFIGSNLTERLLKLNQQVIGLDNFSTGKQSNLDEVARVVGKNKWKNFKFISGDITDLQICKRACRKVDYVLHQAALGSVPRSIVDPLKTNAVNIDGFLNVLIAARDEKVAKMVFAASSSTYGDHQALPKVEENIGKPLSPYAVTKLVNELYSDVFSSTYNFHSIGLRYFNIFGPRQDPDGAYAAVIPKWINALLNELPVIINGDGHTSRDFCYVENAVQANLLAATVEYDGQNSRVFNIAVGEQTSLNELFSKIINYLSVEKGCRISSLPIYKDFRKGDVRHSLADISKARDLIGYTPTHTVDKGLQASMSWYVQNS